MRNTFVCCTGDNRIQTEGLPTLDALGKSVDSSASGDLRREAGSPVTSPHIATARGSSPALCMLSDVRSQTLMTFNSRYLLGVSGFLFIWTWRRSVSSSPGSVPFGRR
jgi:hypothetical protein